VRRYGVTPALYANTMRIERALCGLIGSTASVTEIGHELGFASLSHFTHFTMYRAGAHHFSKALSSPMLSTSRRVSIFHFVEHTKVFHATMLVTRVEDWWVEAESLEDARVLLATGQGHRNFIGELVHVEVDAVLTHDE
jgi:AraC-like DNA-binding protein